MSNNTEMSPNIAELAKDVQIIKDKLDIQDVLTRYGLRFDLGRLDEWFEIFTEDAVLSTDRPGRLITFNGLKEIREHYNSAFGPSAAKKEEPPAASPEPGELHFGHVELAGIIKVDGDTATAVGWQLGTGIRLWRLRRVDGAWLISETISRCMPNVDRCREIVPANW